MAKTKIFQLAESATREKMYFDQLIEILIIWVSLLQH